MCIPSDFVANNRAVDLSPFTRIFYDCISPAMATGIQGGNMSDLCPSGASEACAGMSHSCCAQHRATVQNVTLTKLDQICIDKAYAASWQIQGNTAAGANIQYQISCMPPISYASTNSIRLAAGMVASLLVILIAYF